MLAQALRLAMLACFLFCGLACGLAQAGQTAVAKASAAPVHALPSASPADLAPAGSPEPGPFPPVLTVGVVAGGWPPLDVLEGNTLSGFSADYLRLVVGAQVKLVPRVYPNMAALLAAACGAEVDVIMSLARAPQRERCLSFTVPYLNDNVALVTRAGNEAIATTARRVERARIAVEIGYVLEPLLHERFPQAEILSFANTDAALRAVAQGRADVYAGFAPVVRYRLIHDDAYRGLHVAYEERIKLRELRFAVPVSKVALRDRLNAAAGAVRPAAAAALRARWLDAARGAGHDDGPRSLPFVLDAGERAWLRSLPPLKVAFDADWLPFTYVSRRGDASGMANDYLDYLSRKLGVTFERVPVTHWPDAESAFQRGEFALLATSVGDGGLPDSTLFTRAFEHFPLVIVGRRDEPMARSLNDYAERRVVLAPHTPAAHALFGGALPIRTSRAATLAEGLALVGNGDADVLVGDAAALDGPLSSQYLETLKVVGAIGTDGATAFAVRADLAPLRTLIDRALDAMSPAEQQEIRNRWTAAAAEHRGGWSVNALRLLPFVIAFGVVLLITLRAYVLLQREMRRRRRAEQVLAKQVELQDTMTEMIPYPLGVRDLENRYLAVNHAFEEITGVRRAEVLGRTGSAVAAWGAENSQRVDGLYRKTLEEGKGQRVEFVFDGAGAPDGERRHGIFWTRLCRDARNAPLCVLGTMIDITDIRRAEMRARASERLLSDVTRSLPAIVFQLRRGPDGRYAFPYLGGDTQRLLGDAATQLMRASALDLARVSLRDRARLAAALERSALLLTPVNTEFRFHGAAGLIWVRAEFVPRRAEDGAVVWSGYAVDANVERARADELARARDLAEAASRAKDDFLAMMSHEIRTPMNGVLGLVEVLERTALNPDQTQMVGMVHESAGALLQILDDLLDYSKIQAGRLVIASEPFDMRELVDNAVGLLAGRAHEKGLKVRVDVEASVAAQLRGDSVRLRQILFNLLSNAIKFTLHGEVSVSVAARDVASPRGKPARQRVAITVADTGIGIAPAAQARLFEPFVQAETSTTRRFGGTGLGLTISRKLAALMGGTLELQSEIGRGTSLTLHIELPLEAQAAHANALCGKRAFVVSEDPRVAAALVHFGVSLGMRTTRLEPGPRAARAIPNLAAHGRADLVFVSETFADAFDGHGVPVIRLTDNPKPSGYRVVASGVRVSVNPLSWRGLDAACAMALTGLPTVAARPALQAEAVLTAPDREKERAAGRLILVAEDHPVNQELMRHQLALLGFACDVADDGAQALEALEKEQYGCLITDCHMPNVSGYDLARRVREIEAAGARKTGGAALRLPILGITANTAPENLRLCREAGMDDCLIKPTRVATLRDQLARWFGVENALRTAQEHAMPGPHAGAGIRGDAAALPDEAGEAGSAPVADPLDLAHMIQVWGSEATVKTLLASFVSAMRDDLDALPALLEDIDIARLREWHHRLAGAVGVLHYPALLAVLETWRSHMNSHTPEQLREEGLALMRTCNAMLDGIEQQAALLA